MRPKVLTKVITALVLAITSTCAFAVDKTDNKSTDIKVQNISSIEQKISLAKLDWTDASGGLALTGSTPKRNVQFYIKRDEIITDASLELYYTPSPSLIPTISQLNVYLNGLLQKSIPIKKEDLGVKNRVLIPIENYAIKDQNQFEFEFIGHYSDYCENPVNTTLWLNISSQTVLSLTKQKLHIANDLSSFPVPFFNVSTSEKSMLSFVFPEKIDNDMLKAASVIASFGGVITKWRGIDYPAFINQLPNNGHAVVFLTNDNRPDFLKDYPKVDAPSIEMADIKASQSDKLLIISAPTSEELIITAKALAVGNILFNGPKATVLDYKEIEKRKAYDAPEWINTQKQVTLGSLTDFDGQLSAQGFKPRPIDVTLSLPPDLYFVNGSHVDLNLVYKYSKPSSLGLSQLRLLINDHLIKSYPLKSDVETDSITENLPLIGNLNIFGQTKVDTSYLTAKNTLTFDFNYSSVFASKHNECTTQIPIPNRVEIDPSSTIDFSGLYHFTKMPNLALFWQSGYPFSIYADLQESAALISNSNDVTEITALLNCLGRIGAQLGYACTNIEIYANPQKSDVAKIADKDLLVIGDVPDFLRDDENATIVLNKTKQAISTSFNSNNPRAFDEDKKSVAQKITAKSEQGLGALVSFKSPLNSDRTVVAILADSSKGMANVNQNLIFNYNYVDAGGSLTVIKADQSRIYDVGESYYLGNLPWYQRVYYMLLESPWLLMLLCIFSSIVFCIFCYKLLKHIQNARLKKNNLRKAQ